MAGRARELIVEVEAVRFVKQPPAPGELAELQASSSG